MRPDVLIGTIGIAGLLGVPWVGGQECIPPEGSIEYSRITDNYAFIASSAEGAVGDVVAVHIAVRIDAPVPERRLFGAVVACCYDESKLEFLSPIAYSPQFDELVYFGHFYDGNVDTRPGAPAGTRGFVQSAGFRREPVESLLLLGQQVPLMTAYFRIKGAPGERSLVRLCDGALEVRGTGSCERNFLLYEGESVFESVYARSTRHVSGQVAVIPGPATHPDPPSLPPDAEAYPEAPTAETAGIRFELSGAVAQPGARDVPLEVHVTSNHEWSGFSLSVAFPAGLLEAARVEEHTRPGVIRLDNERGFVGMVMTNSRRRIGAEGERVHLATIHVNLKEAAAEAGEVLLAFEPRDGFLNWLAIHHRERVNPEALPITAEVEPLFVARGLLRVQTRATAPGDVNLDYELNLTDPVVLLNALFLDEEILCPEAGDFNEDAQVNVSDAVAILNHLFLGGRRPAPREVLCGASGE